MKERVLFFLFLFFVFVFPESCPVIGEINKEAPLTPKNVRDLQNEFYKITERFSELWWRSQEIPPLVELNSMNVILKHLWKDVLQKPGIFKYHNSQGLVLMRFISGLTQILDKKYPRGIVLLELARVEATMIENDHPEKHDPLDLASFIVPITNEQISKSLSICNCEKKVHSNLKSTYRENHEMKMVALKLGRTLGLDKEKGVRRVERMIGDVEMGLEL